MHAKSMVQWKQMGYQLPHPLGVFSRSNQVKPPVFPHLSPHRGQWGIQLTGALGLIYSCGLHPIISLICYSWDYYTLVHVYMMLIACVYACVYAVYDTRLSSILILTVGHDSIAKCVHVCMTLPGILILIVDHDNIINCVSVCVCVCVCEREREREREHEYYSDAH